MATKKKVAKKATPKKEVTRKKTETFVRKIQHQTNGSTTVAIPPELFRELGWRDKQKVVVKQKGETIVISDWKPKK